MRLHKKMRAFREKGSAGGQHTFFHWLLLVIGNIFSGIAFVLVGTLMILNAMVFLQIESGLIRIALGLPLFLIGVSVVIASAYKILASIFDRYHSREHCPFCSTPEKDTDGYYRA